MADMGRRSFLGASAAGLGVLLPAVSEGGLPIPPVVGRTSRDAAAQRDVLYALLGDLPDRERPLSAKKRSEAERDGFVLETWELELNGLETVPAHVARPARLTGKAPAVLFNHSHGGGYDIGKREFLEGRTYLQPEPYAKALTAQGYVALCIDHWCFGERNTATELDTFKAMIWEGRVLWGMMVYDSLRALDWLAARPDVDPSRIGTLGMSMGSSMAQWVGALDPRVKATVDICCLTEYHTLIKEKGLAGHGIYYYVPSLLKHFTASDINALIAPRAHLAIEGNKDPLAPAAGLDLIDAELKKVYQEAGHPERWKILRYDVGHQETPEGRAEAIGFLRTFL